jgi:NAD-dependent DNA ligase
MARKNERTDVVTVLQVMEIHGKPLRGLRLSISGHLSKPRTEIVCLIEQAGGTFDPSPSWGTNFLITNGDFSAGVVSGSRSAKILKAQASGTRIISEELFLEMLTKESDPAG